MGLGEVQDGGCTVVMAVHCDGMRGFDGGWSRQQIERQWIKSQQGAWL